MRTYRCDVREVSCSILCIPFDSNFHSMGALAAARPVTLARTAGHGYVPLWECIHSFLEMIIIPFLCFSTFTIVILIAHLTFPPQIIIVFLYGSLLYLPLFYILFFIHSYQCYGADSPRKSLLAPALSQTFAGFRQASPRRNSMIGTPVRMLLRAPLSKPFAEPS
ncbi:hypothetical protein B0H14DRAFT_171580 [Mycena olivaceomarginata]|nr:hypothetical protein B0H14DRAFT_171580 [Mycena olivaceomarginata]